jgi:hypothetical protein
MLTLKNQILYDYPAKDILYGLISTRPRKDYNGSGGLKTDTGTLTILQLTIPLLSQEHHDTPTNSHSRG